MPKSNNAKYVDGEKLAAALVQKGMTLSDLALKTSVGVATVTGTWMKTASVPEYKMRLICAALGMKECDLFISEDAARAAGRKKMTSAMRSIAFLAESHGDDLKRLVRSYTMASIDEWLVRGKEPPIKLIDGVAKRYGVDAGDILTGKIGNSKKAETPSEAAANPADKPIVINAEGLALIDLEELKAEIAAAVRQEDKAALIAEVRGETIKSFQNRMKLYLKGLASRIESCKASEEMYKNTGNRRGLDAANYNRAECAKEIRVVKELAAFLKINLDAEEAKHV